MSATSQRSRFKAEKARAIAAEVCDALRPHCVRIEVAGSLRRGCPTVGDVEIVYVPAIEVRPDPESMFGTIEVNAADAAIAELERTGVLARRLNSAGQETFGQLNKLMRHGASLVPVDLFATTLENWWNCLVMRTGPAELNARIASTALGRGWNWKTYGRGFTRQVPLAGEAITEHVVRSEREVFSFVGIPYLEPHERNSQ